MKVLDFGSGPQKDVETLWTPNFGIRALQASVEEEIKKLVVHAFDPLAITTESNTQSADVDFYFHTDFEALPSGLDVICALHPNPGVLLSLEFTGEEWVFHHNRYMCMLIHAINKNLKSGGRIILQFDDELENILAPSGSRSFIQQISREYRYTLTEISQNTEKSHFPPGDYSFSSSHVLEKRAL